VTVTYLFSALVTNEDRVFSLSFVDLRENHFRLKLLQWTAVSKVDWGLSNDMKISTLSLMGFNMKKLRKIGFSSLKYKQLAVDFFNQQLLAGCKVVCVYV